MSDDNDGYSWGTEIAEGALQNEAQSLLGYGLSSLGVGFPDPTDDAIAKLQSELNLIEKQINSLKSEMDDALTAIDRSEYDNRSEYLDGIMDAISDLSSKLHDALAGSSSSNPPTLADLTNPSKLAEKTVIVTGIEAANLPNQLSVIHEGVTGHTNGVSLYQLLSNLIKDRHRFLTQRDCLAVQTQLNYYRNAQYTQLWLVVNYYRLKGATDFIQDAINTVQGNIGNEEHRFQTNTSIEEGTVVDQNSNLMLYVGGCPWVDFGSVQGIISQMNANWAGGANDWRLPTVAELLGDDNTVGLFSGYDSNDGSPVEWLTKHGFTNDMNGIHFWTSTQVPAPERRDFGHYGQRSNEAYQEAYGKWQDGGPPQYCVDSANLNYFGVDQPNPAHVVAVRNILPFQKEPLFVYDS